MITIQKNIVINNRLGNITANWNIRFYNVSVTFVQRHMKGCSNKSTLEREQTSLTRFDAGEDIWLRSLKNL